MGISRNAFLGILRGKKEAPRPRRRLWPILSTFPFLSPLFFHCHKKLRPAKDIGPAGNGSPAEPRFYLLPMALRTADSKMQSMQQAEQYEHVPQILNQPGFRMPFCFSPSGTKSHPPARRAACRLKKPSMFIIILRLFPNLYAGSCRLDKR